jgi:hypothetical protein
MPLLLIHAETNDLLLFKRGEGNEAVDAYEDGYRGLSDTTNEKLERAATQRKGRKS